MLFLHLLRCQQFKKWVYFLLVGRWPPCQHWRLSAHPHSPISGKQMESACRAALPSKKKKKNPVLSPNKIFNISLQRADGYGVLRVLAPLIMKVWAERPTNFISSWFLYSGPPLNLEKVCIIKCIAGFVPEWNFLFSSGLSLFWCKGFTQHTLDVWWLSHNLMVTPLSWERNSM